MRYAAYLLILMLAFAATGCGKKGLSGTIRTTGKVTYQGAPVEGATVVFSPVGEGRAASAITDAQGNYALTTLEQGDGALAGKYTVTVSKTTVGGKTNMTPDEARATLAKGRPTILPQQDALPVRYKTNAGNLTAEVTSGGKNEFPLDLVD